MNALERKALAASPYSVRNLKTFQGRDWPGFNATVYEGTRKIAEAIQDGSGGMMDLYFTDKDAAKRVQDEARLEAFAKTLPSETFDLGGKTHVVEANTETLINGLVEILEEQRWAKRRLKAQTAKALVFLTADGKAMQCPLRGLKASTVVCDALLERHPGAKILNTLPESEALELFTTHFIRYE